MLSAPGNMIALLPAGLRQIGVASAWLAACAPVLVAAMVTLGSAAGAAELPPSLAKCAADPDDATRLACYDKAVGGLRNAPAASTHATEPSARATAAPSSSAAEPVAAAAGGSASVAGATSTTPSAASHAADPEDEFGRRGELRHEEKKPATQIEGAVSSYARGPDGKLVVTLDNGQVWGEITANSSVRIQNGDHVRIERGAFGSFLLVAPNKRSTKVTRIR